MTVCRAGNSEKFCLRPRGEAGSAVARYENAEAVSGNAGKSWTGVETGLAPSPRPQTRQAASLRRAERIDNHEEANCWGSTSHGDSGNAHRRARDDEERGAAEAGGGTVPGAAGKLE